MQAEKKIERNIERLVEVFTAPTIVWPGGWEDTIPQWMRDQVTIERLIKAAAPEDGLATDIEAAIYLYTTVLCQMVDHDWVQVYLYLCSKAVKTKGTEVPEDIKVDKITDDQRRQLDELKRFIKRSQRKQLDEKRRAERKEEREERAAKRDKQLPLPFI